MRQWRHLAALAAVCVLGSVSACSSLRTREAPAEPAPPPEPVAVDPASAPPDEIASETLPADAVPAPPCLPAIPPEPRPKPKPKPKPVVKMPPPQPTTAPVVAETPVNGTIDAQVKPINVSVTSILGKKVKGPKGEDLGRVVDVLADATGRVRVAIIDSGGFLGVGNHRIAVDWPLLRFNPDAEEPSLILNVTPEKLQSAPEYKETNRPQMLVVPPPAQPAASAASAAMSPDEPAASASQGKK